MRAPSNGRMVLSIEEPTARHERWGSCWLMVASGTFFALVVMGTMDLNQLGPGEGIGGTDLLTYPLVVLLAMVGVFFWPTSWKAWYELEKVTHRGRGRLPPL